jgi:hypothetical protein
MRINDIDLMNEIINESTTVNNGLGCLSPSVVSPTNNKSFGCFQNPPVINIGTNFLSIPN